MYSVTIIFLLVTLLANSTADDGELIQFKIFICTACKLKRSQVH